jgi:hypothetical protein
MSETALVTILAMPKPFRGHAGVIQRNAIASWTRLQPRPEVILFGHEEGAAECAGELGLIHIPEVARNRYGTPLLVGIIAEGERRASHDLLAYVNADIILLAGFLEGVEKVHQTFPEFLAVGRRTNLEVGEPLDFSEGWGERLKERVHREGALESHTAIDCFVFRRGMYQEVPPLAIGRVWFDQWLIKYARKRGLPVVDLTNFVHMVHQIHDYGHVAGGRQWVYGGAEAEENLEYYGERPHTYTILSATHAMTRDGAIRRVFWRRETAEVKRILWEVFVHKTVRLRKRLGLNGRERV